MDTTACTFPSSLQNSYVVLRALDRVVVEAPGHTSVKISDETQSSIDARISKPFVEIKQSWETNSAHI